MKRALLAGAALLAMTVAGQAATIATLGVNPNSATGHFSAAVPGTAAFDDFVTFQLVGTQFITFASVTNDFACSTATGACANPTDSTDYIRNFTGQLFQQVGDPGGGDDIARGPLVAAIACPENPTGCQVLAGSAILEGGSYYLEITGIGGGTSGFGGNLTTRELAAVPGSRTFPSSPRLRTVAHQGRAHVSSHPRTQL